VLQPYLKSGTPAICLITPEPDRGEKIIQCDNWSFFIWDCLRGIRKAGTFQIVNEVTDPVEAINFLKSLTESAGFSSTRKEITTPLAPHCSLKLIELININDTIIRRHFSGKS